MIKSDTFQEIQEILREKAYKKLETIVDQLGYSSEELEILDNIELQEKLNSINLLLSDKDKIRKTGEVSYKRGKDFEIPKDEEPGLVGIGYNMTRNLLDRKKLILDLIKTKSRNEKISSLEDLINNVKDVDLREKIENELKELNKQTTKFEQQEKELSEEEKKLESSKRQLELDKSKLELLEKKSQIWLSILAKESIASIIGAFLLVIIAICLLVCMFLGIPTTEIIQSAFLLILGYFFGHAVSKK